VIVVGRYLNNISPSCANGRRGIVPLGLGARLRVSLKFKTFTKLILLPIKIRTLSGTNRVKEHHGWKPCGYLLTGTDLAKVEGKWGTGAPL
jgi:hypothetical protein